MEKSWAYKQDQLPSTHPIVGDRINDLDDVQVNFDGIDVREGRIAAEEARRVRGDR